MRVRVRERARARARVRVRVRVRERVSERERERDRHTASGRCECAGTSERVQHDRGAASGNPGHTTARLSKAQRPRPQPEWDPSMYHRAIQVRLVTNIICLLLHLMLCS